MPDDMLFDAIFFIFIFVDQNDIVLIQKLVVLVKTTQKRTVSFKWNDAVLVFRVNLCFKLSLLISALNLTSCSIMASIEFWF